MSWMPKPQPNHNMEEQHGYGGIELTDTMCQRTQAGLPTERYMQNVLINIHRPIEQILGNPQNFNSSINSTPVLSDITFFT